MKLILKEFQAEAVEEMYSQATDARRRAARGKLEVLTLAAPTGAGKTVILTRLIELILQGDESHHPDPRAVFLWVTDQPELNAQTLDKMRATSDVLLPSRLVEIAADFDQEAFTPGTVNFLNTQKLGANSSWTKKTDARQYTLWETIRNTSESSPSNFFVIIDEAHRGTRSDPRKAAEANSIMQKFVLGSDEIPPVPLLIGISATLARFTELLETAARARHPRLHQRVDLDPADVIASGLLKRKVILEYPEQKLGAQFPLLRAGVRVWRDMTQRWAAFCRDEHEAQLVRPILLIQVEDGTKTRTSKTDLDAVAQAVREEAGELAPNAIAHAFQEGSAVVLRDGSTIRYLAPSKINGDPDVAIVLFKTSLNTGWDCPRAEVMVSFRAARDSTYIAQLVGRMVRTPLAREVDRDEVLNSVTLILPGFDQGELKKVIQHLTDPSGDVPPTQVENSRERVIIARAAAMRSCFDAGKSVPTYIIPRRKAVHPIHRLGQLADALTSSGLSPNAGSKARDRLASVLQAEYEGRKNTQRYSDLVKPEGTIRVNPVVLDYATGSTESEESREVAISPEMVTELYEWSRKRLGLDIGLRYWRLRSGRDKSDDYVLTKLELFALASDNEVIDRLNAEAARLTAEWMKVNRGKIAKLPEAKRKEFDQVKQQVSAPTMDFLDLEHHETLDWSAPTDAPTWQYHLYQDTKGLVREKLNSWETAVLHEEMDRPDFVGWLRNRDRQPWALCVPYDVGEAWKGCYPDFIVFTEVDGDVVVDIIDPHLISLEDAPAKAAALARYADQHQDAFGRIDLVIVERVDGEERVRRLSLMDDAIRTRVMGVTTNQHLRDLFRLRG